MSIGLEGQRIRMVNLSSAMAVQFAELADEFTKVIKEIGPNPLRSHRENEGTRSEAGDESRTRPDPQPSELGL